MPSLDFSADSSGIQLGALQVTYDTGSGKTEVYNTSGQITYYKSLKLWDPKYNYTASFNTSFLLNMGPIGDGGSDTTGGGMAFFLSSHRANETQVENGYGEWLGLFNESLNATPAAADSMRRLVAVEFDTFKDSFDPDSNHVGIDISSVVSILNESLAPHGVFLDRNVTTTGTNTSVWIDYNGHDHFLDVYVAPNDGSSMVKPVRPVISQFQIDLSQYLPEIIYLGFSASTGTASETHCVLLWNFNSQGLPVSSSIALALLVGLIVGGVALMVLLFVVTAVALTARKRRRADPSKNWANLNYGPRQFTYRELRKATSGFSADCLLGEGGFGAVYRGVLPSDKTSVAVKCLSQRSKQGEREFVAEVTIIGRLRHKNLVQLIGWCYDRWRGRLLLVYDYMPNGSLDKWLKGENGHDLLGWERRYHVLKGLAAGLLYLHEEWEMVVVHRDLKPSNLMLDADFNARLGDFGLARLIELGNGSDGAETKTIAGTPGYMAPECMDTGEVTKESDLYSFGAVAVELAIGRRLSAQVLRSLWALHQEGRLLEAADKRLASYDAEEMKLVLVLGLACCQLDPLSRPSIRQVVQALSSSSSVSFPLSSFPSPTPAFGPTFPSKESSLSFSTEHLLPDSSSSC